MPLKRLDNFTVIVDHSRMQAMGFCDERTGAPRSVEKWSALGWHEAVACVRAAVWMKGPCYIRLGRGGEKDAHPDILDFDVSCPLALNDGARVCVTGPILLEVKLAKESLAQEGINIGVVDCMLLKPFDAVAFADIARKYEIILSVEEHNVVGGFGSILADACKEFDNWVDGFHLKEEGATVIWPRVAERLREVYLD